MSIRDSVLGLCERLGGTAKFATKTTLNVLLPGSGEVVELVANLLDCAHESSRDQWELDQQRAEELARQVDRARLEKILDLLAKDLKAVLGTVSSFADQPVVARQVVERFIQHDEKIQLVQGLLRDLAPRLMRIEENTDKLLEGQDKLHRTLTSLKKKVARLKKESSRPSATQRAEAWDEPEGPSVYECP